MDHSLNFEMHLIQYSHCNWMYLHQKILVHVQKLIQCNITHKCDSFLHCLNFQRGKQTQKACHNFSFQGVFMSKTHLLLPGCLFEYLVLSSHCSASFLLLINIKLNIFLFWCRESKQFFCIFSIASAAPISQSLCKPL